LKDGENTWQIWSIRQSHERFLVGKLEGERQRLRPMCGLGLILKCTKKIGCDDMDWILVVRDDDETSTSTTNVYKHGPMT
jgi:hypothetical protein